MNGLYKTELVGPKGPWRTVGALELATAAWVEWWNQRRLHRWVWPRAPAEYEAAWYARKAAA